MRRRWWVLGLAILVVGYLVGGGMVSVANVRADEARLQRAIDAVTLPEFQILHPQTSLATSDLWYEWLVAHVPLWRALTFDTYSPWRPGWPVSLTAVYLTPASPALVRTQYLARFDPTSDTALVANGYFLELQADDNVDLSIRIESLPRLPNVAPSAPSMPWPITPTPETGPTQGGEQNRGPLPEARVEIFAHFRVPQPSYRAYPVP